MMPFTKLVRGGLFLGLKIACSLTKYVDIQIHGVDKFQKGSERISVG